MHEDSTDTEPTGSADAAPTGSTETDTVGAAGGTETVGAETGSDPPAHGSDRAFVLGLDGVPWNLLERWADAGELPNFARLFEEGATGPLESTTPATTALAWPSLATGVGPAKHGLYGFRRLESDYSHRMNTADDWGVPALWDLLSPAVVGNVPMTYPAREIDGELVTGMMTPTFDERATHPSELAAEIDARIPSYQVGLNWSEYADRPEDLVVDIESMVAARRALLDRLLDREDWRLGFFVFTAPDRLQHLVWDEERILDHYRTLDELLGDLLERLGEETTLFVVSDHGFGPITRHVHVNTVLERAGYLRRAGDEGPRGALDRLGVSKSSVRGALDRLGLEESTVLDVLPEPLVERVAAAVPGDHVLFDVDHGGTAAFCYGPGLVYVNDTDRFDAGTVSPERRDVVREEVAAVLRTVRDPETGDPVLRVHEGADLFPDDDDAPDLVVRGVGEYQTDTALTDDVFTPTGTVNASHRPEGIALVRGPDIAAGAGLTGASVVDLAPTLLHALGEPLPDHVDGRVWDCFAEGSAPAERPVEYRAAEDAPRPGGTRPDDTRADEDTDETDAVEERLRGLGYLD